MAKKPLKLAVRKTPQELAGEQLAAMYKAEHERASELLTTLALVVFKHGGTVFVSKEVQVLFAELDWRINAEDTADGYEIKLETKPKVKVERNGQA